MKRLIADQITSFQMEKRYFHTSGAILWGQINVSMAFNADGKILYSIGQIQDITERKEMQKQLSREVVCCFWLGKAGLYQAQSLSVKVKLLSAGHSMVLLQSRSSHI